MKRTILRRRAWRGAVASGMLLMSVPAWTAEKTADEDSLLPSEAESLIVTRVAEQVTLTFNSETGKIYSVIYADRISGRPNWKYVPGHENRPAADSG